MLFIFEFIIEPDEDRFHAYCPSLKGCRTCGHTEEEAYENIKEVLELYLEALIDEGDPIPNIGIIENIKDIKPIIRVNDLC
jgi:predicted RNase H-like HicB family nuclease